MADCALYRAQLLEADPAELAGEGNSPLVHHLAGCDSCRRAAERILAGQRALGASLRALEPTVPPALEDLPRASVFRSRWRWPALAAAAVLVLWLGTTARNGRPGDWTAAGDIPAPTQPALGLQANQRAFVFETDNPNITILWFY